MVSTFSEAPPTRKPSISSCLASSAQLPPFTEPVGENTKKKKYNRPTNLLPNIKQRKKMKFFITSYFDKFFNEPWQIKFVFGDYE
jgi:hypothetical protein